MHQYIFPTDDFMLEYESRMQNDYDKNIFYILFNSVKLNIPKE